MGNAAGKTKGAKSEYEKAFSSEANNVAVEAFLSRVVPEPNEVCVLDVGCGAGLLTCALAKRYSRVQIAGIDPSSECISQAEFARNLMPPAIAKRVGFGVASPLELPFEDGRFDLLVSCSTFHFWDFPKECLAEFRRVLRPGGRLILQDWSDDFLACKVRSFVQQKSGHEKWFLYNCDEIQKMLVKCGFSCHSADVFRTSVRFGGLMHVQVSVPYSVKAANRPVASKKASGRSTLPHMPEYGHPDSSILAEQATVLRARPAEISAHPVKDTVFEQTYDDNESLASSASYRTAPSEITPAGSLYGTIQSESDAASVLTWSSAGAHLYSYDNHLNDQAFGDDGLQPPSAPTWYGSFDSQVSL